MRPLDPRRLGSLLGSLGYNRAPLGRSPRGAGFKEWLYFGIGAGPLELVVCFATSDGPPDKPVPRIARMLIFVRDARGFRGFVERSSPSHGRLPGGQVGAFVNRNCVRREGAELELTLDPERAPVRAELTLALTSLPAPLHQVPRPGAPAMNWLVVPRLTATGWIELEGVRHSVKEAPAYHDHNWGTFDFGHDFTWEWGYGFFEADARWSFVLVRFADAARSRALEQALFLWRDGRPARSLTGAELAVCREGLLRPKKLSKVPGSLRLLAPGTACDIPARYAVSAALGDDRLQLEFIPEDALQLLIPCEADERVTRIHEVTGQVTLSGSVEGRRIHQGDAVSSNSLPLEPPVFDLVDGALADVRKCFPRTIARAACLLGDHRPGLRVGDANFAIGACAGTLQRLPFGGERPTLSLHDATLLSLLGGESDLVTACRMGIVELRGDVQALGRFYEAFRVFLHGCVRVPENEARLGRYRAAICQRRKHDRRAF